MRKIQAGFLLSFFFVLCLCAPAGAQLSWGESYYVTDPAGALSAETENELLALNGELESRCQGAQFVVVFLDELDGTEPDAARLLEAWSVGDAGERNGMLLLCVLDRQRAELAAGSGLAAAFTETQASAYLEQHFLEAFDAGEYDRAVTQLAEAVRDWYFAYYGIEAGGTEEERLSAGGFSGFVSAIVVFVLIVGISSLLRGRRRVASNYRSGAVFPFFFGGKRRRGPPVTPPKPSRRRGYGFRTGGYGSHPDDYGFRSRGDRSSGGGRR